MQFHFEKTHYMPVSFIEFVLPKADGTSACGKICSSKRKSVISSNKPKEEGNYDQLYSRPVSKSCASGYVTVLEIGSGETVVSATAPPSHGKRVLSKSCSRTASLSRKKPTNDDASRSSSVPPSTNVVLVRIKSTSSIDARNNVVAAKPHRKQSIKIGSDSSQVKQHLLLKRSSSANSEIRSSSANSLLFSRQSLSEVHHRTKAGGLQHQDQSLGEVHHRSKANGLQHQDQSLSEVHHRSKAGGQLHQDQSLSEVHPRSKAGGQPHQDKAVQCRAASADSKVKVRHKCCQSFRPF